MAETVRKEVTPSVGGIFGIAVALYLLFGVGLVSAATKTVTLRVTGMSCEGCARTIEKALKQVDGVLVARVSYERGEAWIKYDDQKVTAAKLREIIRGAGFGVDGEKAEKDDARRTTQGAEGAAPTQNYSTDLSELRAAFNRDRGSVRLLMLLSPT